MEDRATFIEMELNNGTSVNLALTFGRLLKLRQKKPDAYKRYNDLAMNGIKDELDFVSYIYAAYLCANIDDLDGCMTEEEFTEQIPPNHVAIAIIASQLKVGDMKKKQVSEVRSKGKSQKNG